MDLKHHFLRDAGTVAATCVVLGSGTAVAAVPKPHNFVPPKAHVQHMHADPHNFARPQQT